MAAGGLQARLDALTDRERTMLIALGVTLVLCIVGLTGYFINSGLSTLETENAEMRQALRDIEKHRDTYQRAKAKTAALEVRISHGNVQLQGYLEQAAKTAGVEISETTERPPTPLGKKYLERAVDLRLRKVTVSQLAKFLQSIETGANLVVTTALNVRTRDDKHEDLEVEMTVSTYEHAAPERPAAAKKEEEP